MRPAYRVIVDVAIWLRFLRGLRSSKVTIRTFVAAWRPIEPADRWRGVLRRRHVRFDDGLRRGLDRARLP